MPAAFPPRDATLHPSNRRRGVATATGHRGRVRARTDEEAILISIPAVLRPCRRIAIGAQCSAFDFFWRAEGRPPRAYNEFILSECRRIIRAKRVRRRLAMNRKLAAFIYASITATALGLPRLAHQQVIT